MNKLFSWCFSFCSSLSVHFCSIHAFYCGWYFISILPFTFAYVKFPCTLPLVVHNTYRSNCSKRQAFIFQWQCRTFMYMYCEDTSISVPVASLVRWTANRTYTRKQKRIIPASNAQIVTRIQKKCANLLPQKPLYKINWRRPCAAAYLHASSQCA